MASVYGPEWSCLLILDTFGVMLLHLHRIDRYNSWILMDNVLETGPEEVVVGLEAPLVSPNILIFLIKNYCFSIQTWQFTSIQHVPNWSKFTVTIYLPQTEQILIYSCQSTTTINTFHKADDFPPHHRSEHDVH